MTLTRSADRVVIACEGLALIAGQTRACPAAFVPFSPSGRGLGTDAEIRTAAETAGWERRLDADNQPSDLCPACVRDANAGRDVLPVEASRG